MDATLLVLSAIAVLLMARPLIAIPLLCLLIEQETSSGSLAGADPIVAFGQLVYVRADGGSGLRYLAAMTVVAGLFAMARISDRRIRTLALAAGLLAAACVADLIMLGYSTDQLVSWQVVGILWGAICLGLFAGSRSGWQEGFRTAMYLAVGAKAVVAAVALASGHILTADGGYAVVYYDSATLIIAAGVFAVALADKTSSRWLVVVGMVGAGVLAVAALRRTSLVGAGIALVLIAVFGRNRRVTLAGVLGLALLVSVVYLYLPGLFTSFVGGVSSAASGVFGSGGDQSTDGHVSDLSVGLDYARTRPWLGVGPRSPQLPGLVAPSEFIYVHNEFLQAWLMFGFVGLMAVIVFVVASIVLAWRAIRRGLLEEQPAVIFSALVALSLVPGYWFFPHVLTLPRFTLILGWCLGLLAAAEVSGNPEVARPRHRWRL